MLANKAGATSLDVRTEMGVGAAPRRALTKYDGSQTPEQNGFDGPWQYRDCPVFNVLRGIWDAEKITDVDAVVIGALDLWMEQDVSLASLEAQVAPEQLTRAEPAEEEESQVGQVDRPGA